MSDANDGNQAFEASEAIVYLRNSDGVPVIPEILEYTTSIEERLAELEDLAELKLEVGPIEPGAKTFTTAARLNADSEPSETFPFVTGNTDFTDTTKFVRKLYLQPDDWLDNTDARQGFANSWMNLRIGNATLTPQDGEKVEFQANPSWRWAESWRAINTWETLRTSTQTFPVTNFVTGLDNQALTKAMWPDALKTLLRNNEAQIVKSGKDWVGRNASASKYDPFPGVKVLDGSPNGLSYYQTGAVGPMCVEAAFILATQLAGINWKTLRSRIKPESIEAGIYWDSAILVNGNGDQRIVEQRDDGSTRTLGYLSRPKTNPTNGPAGSPDAGFVIALDIDPDIDGWSKDKNVFIFASHLIDPHSRICVNDPNKLRDMKYGDAYEPGTKIPAKGPATGKKAYYFGHAHAAIMPYKSWQNWIGQEPKSGKTGEPMPKYKQIGEMHLYYLTETENNVWPRQAWVNAHPN